MYEQDCKGHPALATITALLIEIAETPFICSWTATDRCRLEIEFESLGEFDDPRP
jgi:hypothetical protein